mmetsp:Transcript_12617/g.27219  ORF Transcript_12617/g.27219 Transcript_12617/m.27219 type:complete len:531 (+) Transcript_12617:150-1742(+)
MGLAFTTADNLTMGAPLSLLEKGSIFFDNVIIFHPITAVLSFLLVVLYLRFRPKKPGIPGPKSYPLVGILPHILKNWDRWPERCCEYSKQFGHRTWGGGLPNLAALGGAAYFLVDPRCVRHVLSENFENYEKGEAFRDLYSELLGTGIFVADGAPWKAHRRLISHMFSRNLLRATGEVTLQKLKIVEGAFRSRIRRRESATGAPFDLQDLFFRMTFDTTAYVVFGCPLDSLRVEGGQHSFARAFDEMQLLISERLVDPLYRIKRALKIGARERRIAELKEILFEETMRIAVQRRRNSRDGGHELGPDLLSRFLDKDLRDDHELHSVVMNIMIAGRDTTACSLAWAFYELSKRPEVVMAIVHEADRVIGSPSDAKDQDYGHERICDLRYTRAVVMEVLRIHPSVPNDHKYALKDDVLPDGTAVSAGSMVVWLPLAMGRSEEIWGDDAGEFRPERFLGAKEPSPFSYPVFNAGPRTCLGKPLAIQTMTMTLAYLLPLFCFTDSIGHDGKFNWSFVRSMKGGFPIDVSERKVG